MKFLLPFLLIFICGIEALGQGKSQTKPSVNAPTKDASNQEKLNPDAEALELYIEIQNLKLEQTACGYNSKPENCATVGDRTVAAYNQAVKNSKAVNYLIAEAVTKYDQLREQTKSAPQVSQIADEQNALLMRLTVVQNQRIIELLEQLVKKK